MSGKEIMTLHLLRGLKSKGYDCFCITSSWRDGDFEERLKALDIPYYSLRIGFISKTVSWSAIRMTLEQALYMPMLYLKYLCLTRKIEPDLVVHTNFHHFFLLFPVLERRKNIYWSHEIISDTTFYRNLFRKFNLRTARFIGVSKAVSTSLAKLVPESKVITIKNGIPAPAAPCIPLKSGRKLNLAIIGQVTRHKGHEVLFNALSDFDFSSANVTLQVVGSGPAEFMNTLKQLAVRLNIEKRLVWRGFIKNTDEIYADVDLVVVPTLKPDPYPTIVMEAGFRGIPAIASDTGGLPELVQDGYNGFLFKAGDEKSLAATIRKALEIHNFDLLKKQSRDFALENFSEGRFIETFDRLLKEIRGYDDNHR